MRSLVVAIVAVTLTAVLWPSGPAALADDNPNSQSWCDPAGSFVPGASLGPVQLGIPLGQISQWYGRPTLVENRRLQGHQWTHMRFNGLDVLGRDNAVAGLNILRSWPVPIPQHCINQGILPFNLPVRSVQQTYGPPILNALVSGLQYWLYDKRGLLVTVPPGGAYVQALTVYQPGQFCYLAPAFISFGGFTANTATALHCPTY